MITIIFLLVTFGINLLLNNFFDNYFIKTKYEEKHFYVSLISLISFNIHAQKKVPKSERGNALLDLKNELIKKYKYESINIYIIAIKLNIDISDIHVKSLPKNIRAERSKEIADFSKTFLEATPDGKKLLSNVSKIGVNHLKKPVGGLFSPPDNTYDSYTY